MRLIIKETFITIKKSFKRFISILLIVLLGVGFFAGIKATSPDMKNTINKYYKDTKFEDISLMSTWGIKEEELKTLQDEGYNAEAYYSFDSIVSGSDGEEVVKVLSYNEKQNINKIVLLEGRLPKNDDECVIETSEFTNLYKIGSSITVDNENLKTKELTIVGIVKTPIFISLERGSTSLLSGKINYFIYSKESNFNMDYYTNVGIYLNEDMYNDNYDKLIKKETKKLEKITDSFIENRYEDEKTKALDKYNKSVKDYEKEKSLTYKKLNNAKVSLQKAKQDYQNGINTYNQNKKKYEEEYTNNLNLINSKKEELNNSLDVVLSTKNELNNKATSINETKMLLESNPSLELYDEGNLVTIDYLNAKLNLITNSYNELVIKEEAIYNGLNELDNNYNLLVESNEEYKNKFNSSLNDLNKAKNTIASTEKSINANEKKAEKEFEKASQKLDDAKEEINNIEKPKWYVLDRESNIGFYQYNQDVDRIKNLGQVFPLVFYLVAVLICLTSMTRIVEEERNQLGTLKSMGFTSSQILFKYILYALLATIIGSIIGLLIGFNVLPNVIFNMYSMMYNVGSIITEFNINYALLATLVSLFCTLGATIIVCVKSLKEQPATLMRPKAIKSGKRILLEKMPFIWNKLKFNSKVTMRNVFRYKKRMIMTIVGVSGCTGLIIAGFGLRDCITGMVSNQFEKVNKYELEITLKDNINNDDIYNELLNIPEIKKMARVEKVAVELENYKTNQDLTLVASLDDLSDFISLQNRKTGEKYNLNDGPIITEKITSLLDIKKGSSIKLKENSKYNFKVNNITENYMYHFIYINKDFYNSDKYNTILVLTDKMTSKEEQALSKKINEIDGISKLQFTSSMAHVFDSTMKNFEYVVIVLIVSANLLAFVVLYNLASVNISERIRELATIKVLGFYDKEVYDYIGRETTILTFLSMVFGIGMGKLLTTFIIKTCELDMIMFNPKISFMSYIYGLIITVLFTIIVNITTYFSLKKIEMIESLKSVE